MAHVETRYVCPVCNGKYNEYIEAVRCRNKHEIRSELWAVGKCKAVRIHENHSPNSVNGINSALREADLSDNIQERRRQLQIIKDKGGNDEK